MVSASSPTFETELTTADVGKESFGLGKLLHMMDMKGYEIPRVKIKVLLRLSAHGLKVLSMESMAASRF